MSSKPKTGLLVMVLCVTFARESAADLQYPDAGKLMAEAIETGHARGILNGDIADLFASQFHSSSPLLGDAKVIKHYQQDGCARVELDFIKEAVPTPTGLTEIQFKTQLDYCRDGNAPVFKEDAQ